MPFADPEPLRQSQREVGKQLDEYFGELCHAFHRAAGNRATHALRYHLAGHGMSLSVIGARLAEVLKPAFAHLTEANAKEASQLEIFTWDVAESGVSLPLPPWEPAPASPVRLNLPPGGEAFRVHISGEDGIFMMFSLTERRAVYCVADARLLGAHIHAAPFAVLFPWWSALVGLQFLHAGCVGAEFGAVLLAGASGSGKSTTSLLCVLHGMRYLSDDFCLVRTHPAPEAFCLFNSGKLHRDHLRRFPVLASRATHPGSASDEKPVIFMHQHYPEQIAPALPLKAVVAPRVTGRIRTEVAPISAAEALKALAPSSLMQCSVGESAAFRNMVVLVRTLPCFRLELGTQLDRIAPAVRGLLESLS